MTRSQNGALLLSCAALSSATPCRFNPGAFLDHFIRSHQHIWRDREADLLSCFQIDDEFKLRRLLHREVCWLGTFENFVDLSGGAPVQFWNVWPIGDQATRVDPSNVGTHRRQPVLDRKLNDGAQRRRPRAQILNHEKPESRPPSAAAFSSAGIPDTHFTEPQPLDSMIRTHVCTVTTNGRPMITSAVQGRSPPRTF